MAVVNCYLSVKIREAITFDICYFGISLWQSGYFLNKYSGKIFISLQYKRVIFNITNDLRIFFPPLKNKVLLLIRRSRDGNKHTVTCHPSAAHGPSLRRVSGQGDGAHIVR